ncbi:hypothetical protein HHK36_012355 [Tetracentron sinense]|uniref:Sn1-specific diacylglycerol lipase alpha n=1 Tax=Tetracentron sinense TaxID=13715 RepID=A0A835DFN1_TETSI|nr:hypothetical protein HHK36_012355 [Tetracentron sinense]
MAIGTMATAAGAAMILYYVLSRRLSLKDGEDDRSGDLSKSSRLGRRRIARRPAQAPATWFEAIATLTETLRFTYSETLGKWPIGDLAFGINYHIRRQGNLQVASIYAGSNCIQLKGPEITLEITYLLRLLTLCMLFSKKPFPVFLESAGYSKEDVLLQEPKAGLLKPAFTILCDRRSKCFLLLIRGTHSIKDTLTAATGAVVPFHHSVLHEGGVSNLILGYAHCGMVAAARWIAKLSTPCLLKVLGEYPDYKIKIIGHSLGGGTAALLTYILRECKELSSSTCVTFAPGKNTCKSVELCSNHSCVFASFGGNLGCWIPRELLRNCPFRSSACMTWDLAESGKHFITTIINGSDLVPTFSTASIDDLRSEVTSSSWLNDLRDQVEHTRILSVVYRSASALGSRLPSIASARARVVGAGALLQPVSSSTQVVMKRAQNVAQAVVRTRSSLTSWSCMGTRRRNVGSISNSKEEGHAPESSVISQTTSESLVTEVIVRDPMMDELDYGCSRDGFGHDETEEEELIPGDCVISTATMEDVTEGELWYELEKELHKQDVQAREEEAAAAIEIIEEENVLVDTVENKKPNTSLNASETHGFFPPGRIMHIVVIPASDATNSVEAGSTEEHVGIYETPRDLYSKLRLSRTMINDHYMPMYKKMMELLISELEKDEDCISII